MKKTISSLLILLILLGCSAKNYEITFTGNGQKFKTAESTYVINTSEKNWKNKTPSFGHKIEPFFLGWEVEGKLINIEEFEMKDYKQNLTMSAKWDQKALTTYLDEEEAEKLAAEKEAAEEEKLAAKKKEEEERVAATLKAEQDKVSAEKKAIEEKSAKKTDKETNEKAADDFIVAATIVLDKNFEDQAYHDLYKEKVDGVNTIFVRMNVTDPALVDAFAYNIREGMFKEEMDYFITNTKKLEKSLVILNQSDYKVLYAINNPANSEAMLYYSINGIEGESLFQR